MVRKTRIDNRFQTLLTAMLIAVGAITMVVILLRSISLGLESTGAVGLWFTGIGSVLEMLLYGILAAAVCLVGLLLLSNRRAVEHGVSHLERIESLLQQQRESVRTLVSMAGLSDQAKSLIYYDREVEALRESVNALLMKQDYAGAEAMIARMETRLGLTDMAGELRNEIETTRDATSDDKVMVTVNRVRHAMEERHWSRAKREAERLLALFPNSRLVASLPEEIRSAWSAYKRKCLKEYGEAVRVNDVERSIELLKELDKYLTPQEGAALSESARDVFKKKLHNLGVQFAIAVADQNWTFAVATGEEIIREYPNSRMAREVREKLDLLRDYATGQRQPSASIVDQPDSPYAEGGPLQTPPPADNTPPEE